MLFIKVGEEMNTEVMFSSTTPEWATPQDLFDRLNEKYHFNLDPASTDENAKCLNHYTANDDGLAQPWGGGAHGVLQSTIRQRNL